ncbi:ribonuclease III [Xylona heveae TC161]|uniref:Large ribosomal subunit protein mL44 n=1 Tax=Xylona heveae (strain CBS 132557 / TC161) TaxID=1328760 RepID=A0A165HER3_XYLHT|nr:ribonuclease III [Xylona heveae TC161]KZF23400.1 ribonuclease III [Xylona heveae TC161]
MNRLRLERWCGQVLSARPTRACHAHLSISRPCAARSLNVRYQSNSAATDASSSEAPSAPAATAAAAAATAAATAAPSLSSSQPSATSPAEPATSSSSSFSSPSPSSEPISSLPPSSAEQDIVYDYETLTQYPSPPPELARSSAKLAALHARLGLPERFPLETLARALVDPSADPAPRFNNGSLRTLGNNLLGYYAAEHLVCKYPRLPLTVLFQAVYAYIGPKALSQVRHEWGIELAAEPGGEVDPGLLQFARLTPGETPAEGTSGRPNEEMGWRRGMSSRVVYDNMYGEPKTEMEASERPELAPGVTVEDKRGETAEHAGANCVRAIFGGLYLHAGRPAAKKFFHDHFLSRQLDIAALFQFNQPTRDLSRLCAREGFEPLIARLLSETGRHSRHPVFVVGVYSGKDKLGEGIGGSLDEARIRAAISSLKGWYLYSPMDTRVPSDVEGQDGASVSWKPVYVDGGEVVV